jgi:lysophospholipase L1-like esterase
MNETASQTTPTEQQPRRSRSLLKKVAFALICCAITLALLEAAVRIRAKLRYGGTSPLAGDAIYTRDKTLDLRVLTPGFSLSGSKVNLSINSLGFRGDEFSRQKPPDTVRIACVGASTTFCIEATSNETTWPARLQSLLQAQQPDVNIEVINAGVGGYLMDESLKNVQYRVLPLQPDLVIFYEGHNDLVIDTRKLAIQRGILLEQSGRPSKLRSFLTQKSLLYYLIDKNLTLLMNDQSSVKGKLTEIPAELPDRYVEKLGVMHDMLSKDGVQLVTSRFLIRFRRDQSREVQLTNADVAFIYAPWMTIDSFLDSFDLYNGAIEQFAKSRQIPFVADHDGVPGDSVHYTDHVHFSDAGCEAMAQRFARFFKEQKLLEPIVAKLKPSTNLNNLQK